MLKWIPVITEERCSGCRLCIMACRTRCLEMVDGVSTLVRPSECRSEADCAEACGSAAITMKWKSIRPNIAARTLTLKRRTPVQRVVR